MDQRTALVTGGCGFVGAAIVPVLVAQGWRVRVLDNLSSAVPGALEGIEFELMEADVRDRQAVSVATRGVQAVVHLAAQSGVALSVEDPHADEAINVGGTLNVLEASWRGGVRRVVVASSTAPVAGAPPPVDEHTLPAPLSPYGASKLAAEAYVAAFHRTFGLLAIALRFANIYGPWSTRKSSVVASFVRDALATNTMTIHGDGTQTRDLVYVSDVAGAVLRALDRPEVSGGPLHISSGTETSINELAALVRQALGRPDIAVKYAPAHTADAHRIAATPRRADEQLGWRAVTDLRTGVSETCRWFLTHASLAVHQ